MNAALSRGDIHNVVRQSIRVATEHNVPVVGHMNVPLDENSPLIPPPPPPIPEVGNAVLEVPNDDGSAAVLPATTPSSNLGGATNSLVAGRDVDPDDNNGNARKQDIPLESGGGGSSHHRRNISEGFMDTPKEKSAKSSTTHLENTPTLTEGGDSVGVLANNNFKETIMSSTSFEHSPGFVNLRKTVNAATIASINSVSGVASHPLLISPVRQQRPPTHRPPKRNSNPKQHRQRGTSHSRSQSLLGLFPIKSVFDELEEENEVRELFDAPPAVNTEERLSREYNNLTPRSLARKRHHNQKTWIKHV